MVVTVVIINGSQIRLQYTMSTLSLLSPAKLNLMLHITGPRDDGYHQLQTLFQLLDYGDTLHFQTRDDNELHLSPAIAGIAMEDNLIFQAARLLQQQSTCSALGANIRLEKMLPMGGGLGGGSSNAATTLLALNRLWQLDLSIDQLADLARSWAPMYQYLSEAIRLSPKA